MQETSRFPPLPRYTDANATLLELLDRVVEKGVVIAGDMTLSVADIDLLYLGVRLLLCSADRLPEWSPVCRG